MSLLRARNVPAHHKYLLLAGVISGAAALTFALPRIPQWQTYHDFADKRGFAGIPNAANVLSNLAFALVGAYGFAQLRNSRVTHARERWPYATFFAGVSLTALGSAYYHIEPNNSRLVFDRLPMAIAFMAVLAGVFGDRIGAKVGTRAVLVLAPAGAASVIYWGATEANGHGDLRAYALVPAIGAITIPLLIALFEPRYTGTKYLGMAGASYGIAKLFELLDKPIYRAGHIVSGHTLKHLAAAAAPLFIAIMLRRRERVEPQAPLVASVAEEQIPAV